ncbi:MAG: hypothetical protein H7Z73_12845 [Candidatus Saccharibacteria bacterium]|nr:hypothetical protein [Moraxellaceae bacterium]
MTTSKIKIKLGAIEIEYEGSETFLKEELPQLLTAVSDLYAKSHTTFVSDLNSTSIAEQSGNINQIENFEATLTTIAAKLNVKSGPELVLASVARRTFCLAEERVTRENIIIEMKLAPSYYNQSYTGNLTPTLLRLVKSGKLKEPSQNVYTLTADTRRELEISLGIS